MESESVKVYKTSDGSFLALSERSYSVIDGDKLEAVVSETVGLKTSVWREKITKKRIEELELLFEEQRAERDRETIEMLKQIEHINFQLKESKKRWREANDEEKQANTLSYQAENLKRKNMTISISRQSTPS